VSIRVIVADDHGLMRAGIKRLLTGEYVCAAEAETGAQLLQLCVCPQNFEVIILDYDLPDYAAISLIPEILRRCPNAGLVVLTSIASAETVLPLLRLGVHGILTKTDASVDSLIEACRAASQGRSYYTGAVSMIMVRAVAGDRMEQRPLTARETEVLRMVAAGKNSNQIAKLLFITEATVRSYRKALRRKLEAANTAEMIHRALQRGLISSSNGNPRTMRVDGD
jgi:DNA-binding NarL/FixJ family response regulator